MLRRSHKKSRAGCLECKRRHVKASFAFRMILNLIRAQYLKNTALLTNHLNYVGISVTSSGRDVSFAPFLKGSAVIHRRPPLSHYQRHRQLHQPHRQQSQRQTRPTPRPSSLPAMPAPSPASLFQILQAEARSFQVQARPRPTSTWATWNCLSSSTSPSTPPS